MKFAIQLILTLIVSGIVQYFLPWWTMAIAAFVIGYIISNKGFTSFVAGFIGVGLLWFGVAYFIDSTTHSILTSKVNQLLPVNSFVLTTLIGGLVGGFAALSGALFSAKRIR